MFTFSTARQHYYHAATSAHLHDWKTVEREASAVISLYDAPATSQCWPVTMTLSQVYLAQARLSHSGPEGAGGALVPVFEIPDEQRIPQMAQALNRIRALLAPRVAYLIGTCDHNGTTNVIPVSNVTSVSTDPQHVLLAVYKQWRTHDVLLDAAGFTLSVPRIDHLAGVWILAARYSHYPAANPREKITASGLTFDYDASPHGPVLVDSIGWMDCHAIERIDLGGDHGIIVGRAQQVWFNPEFLDSEGIPHAQTSPLMQVTGNRFATATQIQQVPYYD